MKKLVIGIVLLSVLGFLAFSLWQSTDDVESLDSLGAESEPLVVSDRPYMRAAHWFGGAWPVNFWNTDLEARAKNDFDLIKEDGFNTVVLLVPWPGFAPDPRSGLLDAERVERLRKLMLLAHESELQTVIRLSYAWDWLDRESGTRLLQLWLDKEMHAGWLDYVEGIWGVVEDVPGFQFGFFSWEDLWAVTHLAGADRAFRCEAALSSGFAEWLGKHYEIDVVGQQFEEAFDRLEDVCIPKRTEPAFAFFLEFTNNAWVDRFFLPAQSRFPRLSMEIRIDSDPVYDDETMVEWFDHRPAWDLPGADWVTLYWSPAMGGQNQGESLTPETAVERLDWWLKEVVQHSGQRRPFIGQFLVQDFTPGYEKNGRIPEQDVPEFLELAADTLARHAGGVGLWTWTDYAHDAIANPEFFVGLEGWDADPEIDLAAPGIRLPEGASIRTELARFAYQIPGGSDQAELCVEAVASEPTGLRVYLDREESMAGRFEFAEGRHRHCLNHRLSARHLRLEAEAPLSIARVNNTGFVQRSGMRNLDFSPKPVARFYRRLNEKLEYQPELLQPRFSDGWMGRHLLEMHELDAGASHLELETHLPASWPEQPLLRVSVNGEYLGSVDCTQGARHSFELPTGMTDQQLFSVRIEASAAHEVDGDERELACHLSRLSFRQDDLQDSGPDAR